MGKGMQISGWHARIKPKENISNCKEFSLLTKLYKQIIIASMSFFDKKGIEYIQVPATTGAASSPAEPGSDSAPVVVNINGSTTMLMDSAQFHLEYACRVFRNGCFYFGHSFRDETPDFRHLSQFLHIEAEIPGTLEDVKLLVEEYIRYITNDIWIRYKDELYEIDGINERINCVLRNKQHFKSISFNDACKILSKVDKAVEECAYNTYRITSIGEQYLLRNCGDFLWVEKWPKLSVPFYQATNGEDYAINADLLFGIGEVVGVGQRHTNSTELSKAISEHGLDTNSYSWYIKMKDAAPMKTSGFGIGVERFFLWLLGMDDIRDIELFPRDRNQKGDI